MKVSEKNGRADAQGTTANYEHDVAQTAKSNGTAQTKEEQKAKPAEDKAKAATEKIEPAVAKQIEEPKPVKFALNLESTLKIVSDLHRRSVQRENLLSRIAQLEAFEITLMEQGDELESNHFQGCKLMIVDDKNRQFTTNTANLIKMVVDYIRKACLDKLAEIEANIIFPTA